MIAGSFVSSPMYCRVNSAPTRHHVYGTHKLEYRTPRPAGHSPRLCGMQDCHSIFLTSYTVVDAVSGHASPGAASLYGTQQMFWHEVKIRYVVNPISVSTPCNRYRPVRSRSFCKFDHRPYKCRQRFPQLLTHWRPFGFQHQYQRQRWRWRWRQRRLVASQTAALCCLVPGSHPATGLARALQRNFGLSNIPVSK